MSRDVTRSHAIFGDFSRPLVISQARRPPVGCETKAKTHHITQLKTSPSRRVRSLACQQQNGWSSRSAVRPTAIRSKLVAARGCCPLPFPWLQLAARLIAMATRTRYVANSRRSSCVAPLRCAEPRPQRSNALSLIGRKRRSYAILRDLTRSYAPLRAAWPLSV